MNVPRVNTGAPTGALVPAERAFGPTFDPERIGWIDFETRGTVDIAAGAYRYATQADAVVLSYAIGTGNVRRIAVPRFPATLDMIDLPTEFLAFHAKVMTGTGIWAAWNASFDRAIWNYACTGFPELAPHHIVDVMAQAVASGLPPDLSAAAVASHSVKKLESGRDLIRLFCLPASTATPQSHPAEWLAFLDYADRDIEAMRSVFLSTRQLALAEWREYWAMEAINDRGACIDLPMVEAAAKLAAEDKVRANGELRAITGDPKMTVDMVKRLTAWLLDRLPEEGRAIVTKRAEEVDEDGAVVRPAKHALTRRQVERLIAYVNDLEMPHSDILRLLQIRLYGGSKTPAKFGRMLASHVDGALFGQYVFNGAAQTGRASSRGVQVHNLARDTLSNEPNVIDGIIGGCKYDDLSAYPGASPVSRQLSLLIRPAFVPSRPENVFVWSDWSQIEARVLPWLVGDDPGALARLGVFRAVDNDKSVPDLYTRTAAALSRVPVAQVDKPMRQRGKVAELALGFGGSTGALQAMAAGYGLHLEDADALQTVTRWREANPWCVKFWQALGDAADAAMRLRRPQRAGRVVYSFAPDYLGGSLFCTLPSGRLLTYRALRYERVEEKDDDGRVTGRRRQLRFSRGHGRVKLWHGMLCLAEGTPVLTEAGWMPIEQVGDERVWDGDAWVTHGGVVYKGEREVIELDGVSLTPDHKVLTTEGWKDAARVGHNRAPVRLPDGHTLPVEHADVRASVAGALRLRPGAAAAGEAFQRRRLPILRLQDIGAAVEGGQGQAVAVAANARHVEASGLLGVAEHARPLPPSYASGVGALRRARHRRLSGVGSFIRAILGRHGPYVQEGDDAGACGQFARLLPGKLRVGDVESAGVEPTGQSLHRNAVGPDYGGGSGAAFGTGQDDDYVPRATRRARVYDILDAGRQNRFVVAGLTAPFIVHNCENVVQAVAADVLRGTLVKLERLGARVRLHTHDEVLVECDRENADGVADGLRAIMREGFDWSAGLPLMSEETLGYYYTKHEGSHGL